MVCKADHIPSKFLKAVFHKFYLVHSWIPWPICSPALLIDQFSGGVIKWNCNFQWEKSETILDSSVIYTVVNVQEKSDAYT